jgi:hypothetical protein
VRHSQQNVFVRFILRTIDVLVSLYFGRSTRWGEEPFRKATQAERRVGGLFMALWPMSMLIFMRCSKPFGGWVDSMMYGHHSIIWLYLAFIGVVCFAIFIALKIAPKISLAVSIPTAAIMWPVLLWYAWTKLI